MPNISITSEDLETLNIMKAKTRQQHREIFHKILQFYLERYPLEGI